MHMQCTKTHAYTKRQRQRNKNSEEIDNMNATWLIAYTWSRWQNQLCNASSLCATTIHCCNYLINKPFMNFIMEMWTICFQCIPLWLNDIKSINIWFVFFLFGFNEKFVLFINESFWICCQCLWTISLTNKWRICKISVSVTFTTSLLLLIGWIEAWWNRAQNKPT